MDNILTWGNYILLSAAETWIGYRLFNTYLKRNTVRNIYYILGIILYFLFQLLSYIYESPMFSTAIYYFVFSLLIAIIFFSDSLQNKITIALLFVIMNYASKTTVTAIALSLGLLNVPSASTNYRVIMDASSQMIACLLFVLTLWGTIRIRKLRLNKQELLYSAISYLFPVMVLFSIIAFSLNYVGDTFTSNIKLFYIYASVLLFSASISLFYLLEKNILLDMYDEKSSIMGKLLSLQRSHYTKLDLSQRELQSLRHDMKKHLQCLYTLCADHHYQAVHEYIKALCDRNTVLKGMIHSGNLVIDAILNNILATVEKRDIDLKYSIIIPPALNIEDVDLCIVFGNLVDNAVEACEQITDPLQKKFITLNVSIKKDYLFIDITNSFNGKVKKYNNNYLSIKKDEPYPGIGLSNTKKIVQKYNGEIAITNTHHTFNVSIILCLCSTK
ncbi:MAG TPA: GHKL domain-containing protein [Candidatus Avacidaminococcus intestinavium]|uniref:GHKL domain-containing protein n=1 Tax=Candidatus Avacidaminococcus intestinavium TaxID=2840684 RepID=A0A9D1MNQ9_9FIRM|nr:GHKL domain-containing protein [Candidatus Avacidaminococcus intestinavium]